MKTNWLERMHAGLFAIPFGLFELSSAWHRAVGFGWQVASDVSSLILYFTCLVWAILLVLYVARCIRYRHALLNEFMNPVQGALMALLPLSILLFVMIQGQPGSNGWLAITLIGLTLQLIIAARVVSMLSHGQMPEFAVTPALYLPPVTGGFVGGIAMAVVGYPGWGALLFGMGLAGWALLEARVLNRIFHGPMPEALRPMIGIEMAPPALATLAAGTIWPELPGEVLIVGLGVAAGPILAVFLRYRWWHKVPFTAGFWSFSFPLAALAGAVIEVVRRGHWPSLVGGIALLIASAVIAFLSIRTVILLFQGRLLPAAHTTPLLDKRTSEH